MDRRGELLVGDRFADRARGCDRRASIDVVEVWRALHLIGRVGGGGRRIGPAAGDRTNLSARWIVGVVGARDDIRRAAGVVTIRNVIAFAHRNSTRRQFRWRTLPTQGGRP